jgi:hypothetical protein
MSPKNTKTPSIQKLVVDYGGVDGLTRRSASPILPLPEKALRRWSFPGLRLAIGSGSSAGG